MGCHRSLIEVNSLVTTLKTSRSSGSYDYLGQFNGIHTLYLIGSELGQSRDQANADGAYLVVINSEAEREFLESMNREGG